MANDSSTGGYLLAIAPELNDDALTDLIQAWFVGLTGLPGNLVIPMWQPEPPPTPPNSTTWLSLGIKDAERDWDAHFSYTPAPGAIAPSLRLFRMEVLDVDCVSYGTNSRAVAAAIWNNYRVSQNREVLVPAGFAPIEVTNPETMTEKIKQKYVSRTDFRVRLRRAVSLRYPVLDIESATITVNVDEPALQVPVVVNSEE